MVLLISLLANNIFSQGAIVDRGKNLFSFPTSLAVGTSKEQGRIFSIGGTYIGSGVFELGLQFGSIKNGNRKGGLLSAHTSFFILKESEKPFSLSLDIQYQRTSVSNNFSTNRLSIWGYGLSFYKTASGPGKKRNFIFRISPKILQSPDGEYDNKFAIGLGIIFNKYTRLGFFSFQPYFNLITGLCCGKSGNTIGITINKSIFVGKKEKTDNQVQ